MSAKIIGAGFQKTGTSTLREALKILGYRVKDTTPRALIPILRGNYSKIEKILQGYDAAEDTPWFKIYKELDKLFPGSKFILTIRDKESWYKSVSKHIGSLPAAHHEWIYGKGKGLPGRDKKNTIDVFEKHNADVLAYFESRPDDLLVMDITKGDGWESLCTFLQKPIPDIPFPHFNKSSEAEKRQGTIRSKLRFQRQRVKNLLKIYYINITGLGN